MAAFRMLGAIGRKCHLTALTRPLVRFSRPMSAKSEWADDGLGLGDYPNMPEISAQMKPAHGWWDVQERRNYGETVQVEDDALNLWMYDAPEKSLHTPKQAVRYLLTTFTLLGVFMFSGYLYGNTKQGNRNDYTPKQFPYNDNHVIYKDGDPKQRLKIN